MQGVDPKVSMWLMISVAIAGVLVGAGGELTTLFGTGIAAKIMAGAGLGGAISAAVAAALHGYSSPAPGPLVSAPPPPVTKVAAAIGALALIAGLLAPGEAYAQTRHAAAPAQPVICDPAHLLPGCQQAPATSGAADPLAGIDVNGVGKQLQAVAKDLVDKGIADLQAASTDAKNRNDKIAQPCWDAQVGFLQLLPVEWQTPPTDVGPALAIQISRDLMNAITGSDQTSLKVACAALWGDQLNILQNALAVVGIKAALTAAGVP